MKEYPVSQKYDHYYLYEEILALEETYLSNHPGYVKREKIGETQQGRPIYVMEITDLSTGDFADKPAFYTEGNIHAGEVTGCMTTMYLMDVIFTNIDDPYIAGLLKRYTVYVLPRVSPDGSERYLTTPDSLRSVDRLYPTADELPGLSPQDLDGDGVIRCMRVRSPYGAWKPSGKDPRVMSRRKPDDVDGDFYNVYQEGLIHKYDGVHIVPAPAKFGYDYNRNYPVGWRGESEQRGAGEYPLCTPETRANADFLLAHGNICAVIDMHTHGGQILYTPGCKARKEAFKEDIAVYKALGAMGHEESGYPVINVFDEYMPADASATYGGFDDFCHLALGIPGFTIECWDIEARAGVEASYPPKPRTAEQEEDDLVSEYKWVDENCTATEREGAIKEWTPFIHPQLGAVEIGGADVKRLFQNPPVSFLEQELRKHSRFMLRVISALPKISYRSIRVEKLTDGLYSVRASILNSGYLSSYVFQEGLKNKRAKDLTLTLTGADAFVQGEEETNIGQLCGYADISTNMGGYGMSTTGAEKCEKQCAWIVRAESGTVLTLTCTGAHIGKAQTIITLP